MKLSKQKTSSEFQRYNDKSPPEDGDNKQQDRHAVEMIGFRNPATLEVRFSIIILLYTGSPQYYWHRLLYICFLSYIQEDRFNDEV